MTQIKTLTEEQWARCYAGREKWLQVGLSCEPPDKPRAEAAIIGLYAAMDKPPPKITWYDSPLAAGKALRDGLMAKGVDKEAAVNAVMGARWCNLWLARWAHHAICRDSDIGVTYDAEQSKLLDLWLELYSSCGWVFTMDDGVAMTSRPVAIRRDEQNRAHSATGPAIEYPDASEPGGTWRCSVFRGTRVPHDWLTNPGDVDPTLALNHPNLEQRRALAEILGWARVLDRLRETGGRVVEIDRDPDPEIGTLLEVELPDSGTERFLQVRCATGRTFVLCVDPGAKTAREANAASYGLKPEELQLEFRT